MAPYGNGKRRVEVIDLTNSDDEQSRSKIPGLHSSHNRTVRPHKASVIRGVIAPKKSVQTTF